MNNYYSMTMGRREYFFSSEHRLNDAKENSRGMGASDTFYLQNADYVYDYNENEFIKSRRNMLQLLKYISTDCDKTRTPLMSELMGPPC